MLQRMKTKRRKLEERIAMMRTQSYSGKLPPSNRWSRRKNSGGREKRMNKKRELRNLQSML